MTKRRERDNIPASESSSAETLQRWDERMREMSKRKMILGLVWKEVMVFAFVFVFLFFTWPFLVFVFKTSALPMLSLCLLLFMVLELDQECIDLYFRNPAKLSTYLGCVLFPMQGTVTRAEQDKKPSSWTSSSSSFYYYYYYFNFFLKMIKLFGCK